MPKKREFVAAFASALGGQPGLAMMYYRRLSEARLLTFTGARGPGAPDLTRRDASRMLEAALASEDPALGPQAVADWGSLKLSAVHIKEPHPISVIRTLDHSFGLRQSDTVLLEESLERLLTIVGDAVLVHGGGARTFMKVIFYARELRAVIEMPDADYVFDNDDFLARDLRGEVGDDGPHALDRRDFEWARMLGRYGRGLSVARAIYGGELADIAAIFGPSSCTAATAQVALVEGEI